MLLQFTMQMTLIIVLSAALAVTPFFRRQVAALLGSSDATAVVALAFLAADGVLCYGDSFTQSPLIAIYFASEAERRRVPSTSVSARRNVRRTALWQYGLSSAGRCCRRPPLPQDVIGVIPLSTDHLVAGRDYHEYYAGVAILAAGWICRSAAAGSRNILRRRRGQVYRRCPGRQ